MRYPILFLLFVFSVSEVFALNVTMSTKIEGGASQLLLARPIYPMETISWSALNETKAHMADRAKLRFRVASSEAVLSLRKNAFNPGKYTLKVTVPFATTQPSSVQSLIGDHGQNLQGSLVKKGPLQSTVPVSK
jgi:hypothetical protein